MKKTLLVSFVALLAVVALGLAWYRISQALPQTAPAFVPTQHAGSAPVQRAAAGNAAATTAGSAAASPADAPCITTPGSSSDYSVKVCLSGAAPGSTVSKDVMVTATVTVTGNSPGVQHVAFYMDGTYLLEDFTRPYTFSLPSDQWSNGSHKLSAEAFLRDQFTTPRASIPLVFQNAGAPLAAQFQITTGTAPAAGQPLVVAAVGDGAGGDPGETQVVNQIASWNPNLFLYLGDVYEQGTAAEFYNWYRPDTFFGRFKAITDPTVGNHEYLTPHASGYFNFWGSIPHYYSFNAGGWHFISLDSNVGKVPPGAGSAEYQWLQNDLASNKSQCTLVYYHHPFFSIGKEGSTQALADIWKLMAQYHVTLVLNGHDHEYQRWSPLDGNGNPAPNGITEFVVGTGGHSLTTFVTSDGRVAFSLQKNLGALRLDLTPGSAAFSYVTATGTQADSGTVSCKGP